MSPHEKFFATLKSRKAKRNLLVIAGLLAVGLLVAFTMNQQAKEQAKKANARAIPVTEATVVEKSMPVELSTIGHVQAISSVAVKARMDGQIAKVLIKDGQEVKVGDLLVLLDDREAQALLAQAKAALVKDQAQLEFARREAARQLTLVKKGAVSASAQEQTKANADALAAMVEADNALVAQRQTELSYTAIAAPIAGKAGSIAFKEGNTVMASATTPLMTLNQMAPIFVSFSVAQRSLPALQDAIAQGPVKVTASVPGKTADVQTGELSYIENAIDSTTGTLPVRAAFPNETWRLWPGQFVNVVVTLKLEPRAVVVPSVAVQAGQTGSYVFVVKPDQSVEMRTVIVNRTVKDETVVASGLKAGETVVTTGQLRLTPGIKVRTQSEKKAGAQKGSTS